MALGAVLEEESQLNSWRVYVADVTALIARVITRNKKLPFYSDFVKQDGKKTDSRSSAEIVKDIVAARKNKRKRGEAR